MPQVTRYDDRRRICAPPGNGAQIFQPVASYLTWCYVLSSGQ